MTSKNDTTLRIQHAPVARVLAFVLLVLVAYSTTAEAVHKHGNLLLNQAPQTVTAVSEPTDTGSSLNDSRSLGDCLICQLHQNLSTTLFSPLPQVVAPVTQATLAPRTEAFYLSQSDPPRRGRAPPSPSLS